MVTIENAQNALKDAYLGVVSEALNIKANPLLAKISQTSNDVWGKEIIKLTTFGVNGGVGAGTETGALPTSAGNKYVKFVSSLKNLYGVIELSDKAIRASETNVGSFVNLLNSEMEGLIKASNFNFSRMLFGNGTGKLANVSAIASTNITVDSVKNLMEGQVIDLYKTGNDAPSLTARITKIDRANKKVYLSATNSITIGEKETYFITLQNSKDQEITGIGALFDSSVTSLYGVTKADYNWMSPVTKTATDGTLTEDLMQNCIDDIDEVGGSVVDYITCSNNVRRIYQKLLTATRSNIDVMDLQGGFKALSYNGIPVVADRFIEDGNMYLLSTKDFALHQLCDWRWLEDEGGKIIRQKPGYPAFTATLVKYADLICSKPCGQAKISGITK